MSSSAEEAVPVQRTWIDGRTPVAFSLSIDSFLTARGNVILSPETDKRAIVLESSGDVRLTFLLSRFNRSELVHLPNGLWETVLVFPKGRLHLAELRS